MLRKNRRLPILLSVIVLFTVACACPLFTPAYVPVNPGDCFVPPQGDPVYDQFYAENVNPNNCSAFKDQAQGHEYDANAKLIRAEAVQVSSVTAIGNVGAIVTVLITLAFAVIMTVAFLRNN